MKEWVGYSPFIKNTTELNSYYNNVSFLEQTSAIHFLYHKAALKALACMLAKFCLRHADSTCVQG